MEIDNGASPYVDVDENDQLGCIQFAKKRIEDKIAFKGELRFLNLSEIFSVQQPFKTNFSMIKSPGKGQKNN